MAAITVCDECGQKMNVSGFELERWGLVVRVRDSEGPWHFCSAPCLVVWSLRERGDIPEAADA